MRIEKPNDILSPKQVMRKVGNRCPRCGKKLVFDPFKSVKVCARRDLHRLHSRSP